MSHDETESVRTTWNARTFTHIGVQYIASRCAYQPHLAVTPLTSHLTSAMHPCRTPWFRVSSRFIFVSWAWDEPYHSRYDLRTRRFNRSRYRISQICMQICANPYRSQSRDHCKTAFDKIRVARDMHVGYAWFDIWSPRLRILNVAPRMFKSCTWHYLSVLDKDLWYSQCALWEWWYLYVSDSMSGHSLLSTE
jgi:hypothetical protein